MLILSLILSSFLSFSQSDFTDSKEKFTIEMSCYCNIFNDDGLLINGQNKNKIDQFDLVFATQNNVGPTEAQLCHENLLEDITSSCSRAFYKVKEACRQLALPYNTFVIRANNFSVDRSSCFAEVKSLDKSK
jgi:hypothetical protein